MVDDDKDILTVVSILLEANDIEVNALASALSIQQTITAFKPDIILLDIFLSGYDGREICKKLTSESLTMHIPIILFSANTNVDYKQHGATGFIKKPFDIADLVDMLRRNVKAA